MHDTELLLDASQNPKLNHVFEKYSVRKVEVSRPKHVWASSLYPSIYISFCPILLWESLLGGWPWQVCL